MAIDVDTEDDRLTAYLATATELAEVETGRAFVTQTWKLHLASFPSGKLYLPKPPLQSVTHIKYYDEDNSQQTWSSDNYHVMAGTKAQGWVEPINGETYPATYSRPDSVEIQFVCGYTSQPPQVVHGIKMLVATWNELRETENEFKPQEVTMGAQRLFNQLKYGGYQ